jgi:phage shock protein A
MGLFRRVNDIISANLNDMIERFENPEKMLRQAIREMDRSIGEARRDVVRAMADEKIVKRQLADHEAQANDWHGRAVKAVDAGDDRLARRALLRKHENLKVALALKDQLSVSSEASRTLRRQLEAMQVKLAEARRRLQTFIARERVVKVRATLQQSFATQSGASGAFARFEQLQNRVERIEAEAEALTELDKEGDVALQSLSESGDIDPAIEAELAALKSKGS